MRNESADPLWRSVDSNRNHNGIYRTGKILQVYGKVRGVIAEMGLCACGAVAARSRVAGWLMRRFCKRLFATHPTLYI